MKKLVSLALVCIMTMMMLSCSFAETAASYVPANYAKPEAVAASSESAFYGVWKAKCVDLYGTMYELEPLGLAWTYEIFADGAMIYNNNSPFYLTGRSFANGHLTFTDEGGSIELTLQDDGYISFLSDGFAVYCEKQEVVYEELPFRSLARRPENYNGTYAKFSGTVAQVIGTRTGDYYQIRLAVDDNYDQIILAEFIHRPDYNLLEEDQVTVYVHLAGEYTYETVWGNSLTVPLAFVLSNDLVE